MKTDFETYLPADFHESSRVWIYQSSRLFTLSETMQLDILLTHFAAEWKSHGTPVKGFAGLLFGQFIVMMADGTVTEVSGCSKDSSVKVIRDAEAIFGVSLFDRETLAFVVKDRIERLPLSQLPYALENQFITPDTLYFNNTVTTKKEMMEHWIQPVGKSWLSKKIRGLQATVTTC